MITDEDVKQWKPLIKKVAYKYRNNPYRLELEDIEQIGYIGLLKGLKTFNEDLGVKIKTYLYSNIKWSIDSEIEYWKNNKRNTLIQSTSIDVKINGNDDLTISEIIKDDNVNIEESVINGFVIERYRKEIIKTLIDHQESKIILMVLFADLCIEQVSKILKIDIEEAKKSYYKAKEKIRRNMFIKSRYREYIESKTTNNYKNINYYSNTENTVFKTIELEQKLFKIL